MSRSSSESRAEGAADEPRSSGFPDTPGSAVLGVRSDDPVVRGRAFATLVRVYWKPAYKRIRGKWRKSNDDAQDLTQAFFARAFERGTFDAFEPRGVRFRAYVRTCLDRFVANAERDRTAVKRGGGAIELPLDFAGAEAELAEAGAVESACDERAFDEDWARSLLELSHAALRAQLEAEGRTTLLAVFERHVLASEGDRPTYAELAASLGIKVTDVTNHLHAVRKRARRVILAKLREVTLSDEELRSEALALLGVDHDPDGGAESTGRG